MTAVSPTAPIEVRDYLTARAVLVHRDLSRSHKFRNSTDAFEQHVLNLSGADHRRARKALDAAIAPALPTVAALAPGLVGGLLDGLDGEVDAGARFVRPLVLLILDAMFGLSGDLGRWHQVGVAMDSAEAGRGRAAREMFAEVVQSHRDEPRDDVVSRLIATAALSEQELVATVAFTFSAGYTNTCHLLGMSLLALARHPEQYDALRRDPRLVPSAVGELLRYAEAPGRALRRVVERDTCVNGHDLTAGTVVLIRSAAANRDPNVVADGDMLELRRERIAPALAFGAGPHYCLAASVVRTLADLTLLGLIRRIARIEQTERTAPTWDFAEPLWLGLHTESHTLEET